jgi:hypothetical protein
LELEHAQRRHGPFYFDPRTSSVQALSARVLPHVVVDPTVSLGYFETEALRKPLTAKSYALQGEQGVGSIKVVTARETVVLVLTFRSNTITKSAVASMRHLRWTAALPR